MKPPSRDLLVVLSLAWCALLAGCGSPSTPAPATDSPIRIDAARLQIGEYLPPLDGGRIELAEPKGWKRMSRTQDFVAGFYEVDRNGLPRIRVLVDDDPYQLGDTSAENVVELTKRIRGEVESNPALLEVPEPLAIGERHCVRYVLNAKLGDQGAEQQVLITVLGGRRYQVKLDLPKRTIHTYKAAGYAVLASLRPGPGE